MLDAYIYDGLRTPFGRHSGALSPVRPADMLGNVIKTVDERSPFAAESIDDVAVGCGNQAGEDSRCVARHALLVAGLRLGNAPWPGHASGPGRWELSVQTDLGVGTRTQPTPMGFAGILNASAIRRLSDALVSDHDR